MAVSLLFARYTGVCCMNPPSMGATIACWIKVHSASAWVHTRSTNSGTVTVVVVVVVGGGSAGTRACPCCCCILSKRVFSADSLARMFDMSVLSLVAALAMLLRADAMAALSICMSMTFLAAPKELGLALSRRLRLMFVLRYLVCHAAHVCAAGASCYHSLVASG